MFKVLEGQISFGGMHDALEAVARHKNVKYGLLRVTSNTSSGLIGVFCGRFITGAVMSLSGESGYPALRNLLAAKDGSFAFMDASDEPVREVNQSLGVDLQTLLSSTDFSVDNLPISEESLTNMRGAADEVKLIDTSLEFEPAEELTVERINQTYDRILSLSEHLRTTGGELAAGKPEQPAEEVLRQREMQREDLSQFMQQHQEQLAAATAVATGTGDQRSVNQEDFKRLKDWSDKGQKVMVIAWGGILVAVAVLLIIFGPRLATMIGSIVPK